MADEPKLPNIAVVAVHGIGDQEECSSVRDMADLLLRLRGGEESSRYTSFRERPIRLPVKPVRLNEESASQPPAPARRASKLVDQSRFLQQAYQTGETQIAAGGQNAPEHQLMRDLLADYESTGEPYETLRLEGQRLAPDNVGEMEPQANVHVYEMYWADLSRFRGRFLSVFGELYQLLFHVAHLGRVAIDHARLEHPRDALWRAYQRTHELAVQILSLLIPVLFLTALATVTGLVALGLPNDVKPYVITGLATVGAAAAAAVLAYRSAPKRGAAAWLSVPVIAVATALLTSRGVAEEEAERAAIHGVHVDRYMLVSWILLCGAALYLLYRAYDRRRPGAFRFGIGIFGLSAGGMLGMLTLAQTSAALRNGVLNVFEIEIVATILVWSALYVSGAVSAVLGVVAALRLRGDARKRARRVAWTARVTLGLSATSVLVLSFVIGAALLKVYGGRLPNERPVLLFDFFSPAPTYAALFHRVIGITAGPGLPVVLLVAAALFAFSLLALLPAALQEVRAPRHGHSFREFARAHQADPDADWKRQEQDDTSAERGGAWLSIGLKVAGICMTLQYVALFFVMPIMNGTQFITGGRIGALADLQASASSIILGAGAIVAGVQVGAIAISGWANINTLGFRTMLDALLDVDNYLREHPRTHTPRAKIAERFVSLLRYVLHWKGDDNRGYKAIVFVTHSQGTVITADMLNFLQCEADDELSSLRTQTRGEPPPWGMGRVYLFTMGSPLRDLYALAFPHLYGWVRGDHAPWTGERPRDRAFVRDVKRTLEEREEEGRRVTAPPIAADASPEPYDLGVACWVNAYRSGDYVGRALWRDALAGAEAWRFRCAPADARTRYPADHAPIIWVSEDPVGSRRELCIGGGAHTHYWDDSAKAIAMELDSLIENALMLPVYPGPAAHSLALEAEAALKS